MWVGFWKIVGVKNMSEKNKDELSWIEHGKNLDELKKVVELLIPDLYRFHDSQKCKNVRIKLIERILKLEEVIGKL
jgi:hypothetical protein